jgi:hypothetical protein
MKKATFGKPSKGNSMSSATIATLDGANSSSQKVGFEGPKKDALEVVLRVEIDQRDPSGSTKPYQLVVPTLKCEKTATGGGVGSGDSGGGWI